MNQASYWILRGEHRLLTTPENAQGSIFPLDLASAVGNPEQTLSVGELHNVPCYAADVEQLPEIPSGTATPLRAIFQMAGAEAFALAGRATQLLSCRSQSAFHVV